MTATRIRLVFAIVLAGAALIIARLFFLQVVSGEYYKTQASRQQNFSQILTPRRGEIYLSDRKGNLLSLASTKEGYLLFINPKKIKEPEAVLAKLNPLVPLERENFLKRAAKTGDPYEVVAHRLGRPPGPPGR